MSAEYFEQRCDRYYLFKSKELADYIVGIGESYGDGVVKQPVEESPSKEKEVDSSQLEDGYVYVFPQVSPADMEKQHLLNFASFRIITKEPPTITRPSNLF